MADDEFDITKAQPIEGMSKSEFNRWLMDKDSQVKALFRLK